jgi:hypothetical protein
MKTTRQPPADAAIKRMTLMFLSVSLRARIDRDREPG